jgi:hypothetical protein
MAADDESPRRALVTALAAMAGVAVIVGLAVGAVAVVVFHYAGVDGSAASAEAPQSLFIPKYQPTPSATGNDGLHLPNYSPSPSPSFGEQQPSESPSPRQNRITLFVAPQRVSAGERINFNGVYGAGEGKALQVQRLEAGQWTDFPVNATVRGGVFDTWIQTSRTGRAVFRVYDAQADRASNRVVVQIG